MTVLNRRIYAFIDSNNLNLSIKHQGWNLDFKRFRVYLNDKYDVSKAYLCIGMVPGNEALYAYLQESDYILIFKPTLEIKGKHDVTRKGNVDAELVLHTMIQYPDYDGAIIVSGDGDFHCLIEYLDQNGKLERLIVPNRNRFSALLRKFNKRIDYLNGLESKLAKRKRGINLRTKP